MISKSRDAWVTVSRFLPRCRDTERAILPGIRCPVCLLISVFHRIPGIPVVKIVPGIDLYSDNYTKKKKPGFRKFRSDSGFQTGIHPESTRNRGGRGKTSAPSGKGSSLSPQRAAAPSGKGYCLSPQRAAAPSGKGSSLSPQRAAAPSG